MPGKGSMIQHSDQRSESAYPCMFIAWLIKAMCNESQIILQPKLLCLDFLKMLLSWKVEMFHKFLPNFSILISGTESPLFVVIPPRKKRFEIRKFERQDLNFSLDYKVQAE